jgi:diguanylate cyclase (GGDEF)-like protein
MLYQENKIVLLNKVEIFSPLKIYELDIIARYSEHIEYKKGDIIFTQDSKSDGFYVLESGRVGIIRRETQDDFRIAQIKSGESFGELDFFGKNNRSATSLAEEDTTVLKFPASGKKSHEIFQKHSYIFAQMLLKLHRMISLRISTINNHLHEKTDWLKDLRKQLYQDKMTGLYNREFLNEDFIKQLPDPGRDAAFIMIKPDNFKIINDKYGHTAGDNALNLISIFFQSELGENDIGIRYRGDEYAALLADTGKSSAVERAREIGASLKSIDLTGITGRDSITISVSIGISLYPLNTTNSRMLVDIAYNRMMKARSAGGNRICI